MTKAPKNLGAPGRKLWKKLAETCDIEGAEELLMQLCATEDRLGQVRDVLAKAGLLMRGDKGIVVRNPLLDVELRLVAQWGRLWKLLGLADPAEEAKRPVGRPPKGESGGAKWRG